MNKERKYGIVSQEIMQDSNLTIEAKAMYAYLASIAEGGNSCSISIEIMLKEMSMGKNRFYKCMRQLINAGVVEKYATKNEKGGFSVNTYRLVPNMQIMAEKKVVY